MIAAGVARPRAHGQAITSTATALIIAVSRSPLAIHQPSSVTSASTSTTGTKMALTLSTRCWIGALAACASSTSLIMRDKVDSSPTALVRTSSTPAPFMAPPVTCSPACLLTGRLSPVISDSSTSLAPSSTTPSTGMRAPGRTTTRSPSSTWATGTSCSWPSRRTRADSGRSTCSARMAAAVWRLARASSHLPSKTRVMTTAEASKYRCAMPPWPASSRYTLKP